MIVMDIMGAYLSAYMDEKTFMVFRGMITERRVAQGPNLYKK